MNNLFNQINFETVNSQTVSNTNTEKTFINNNKPFISFQSLDGNITPYNSAIDKPLRKKLQGLKPCLKVENEESLKSLIKNISQYSYIKVSNGYLFNTGLKNNNKFIYYYVSDELVNNFKKELKEEKAEEKAEEKNEAKNEAKNSKLK